MVRKMEQSLTRRKVLANTECVIPDAYNLIDNKGCFEETQHSQEKLDTYERRCLNAFPKNITTSNIIARIQPMVSYGQAGYIGLIGDN